jgi:hypothetical protein
VSLKWKARKSLYAKSLAPRVALPYVVAGTIGVAMNQRWYDDITADVGVAKEEREVKIIRKAVGT